MTKSATKKRRNICFFTIGKSLVLRSVVSIFSRCFFISYSYSDCFHLEVKIHCFDCPFHTSGHGIQEIVTNLSCSCTLDFSVPLPFQSCIDHYSGFSPLVRYFTLLTSTSLLLKMFSVVLESVFNSFSVERQLLLLSG